MMRVELSSASQYLLSPFNIPGSVPKVSYASSHLILTRGLCIKVSISFIYKKSLSIFLVLSSPLENVCVVRTLEELPVDSLGGDRWERALSWIADRKGPHGSVCM